MPLNLLSTTKNCKEKRVHKDARLKSSTAFKYGYAQEVKDVQSPGNKDNDLHFNNITKTAVLTRCFYAYMCNMQFLSCT